MNARAREIIAGAAVTGALLGGAIAVSGSAAHTANPPHHHVAVAPRGPAGPAGPAGPPGPPGPNIAASLSLNWSGFANTASFDSSQAALAGLASLSTVCNASVQQLVITPAAQGVRTVADLTTMQGEGVQGISSFQRTESDSGTPIVVALPNNGMITGTISVEPISGTGGVEADPATITLSSQFKLNDPDAADDFCYVAAQAVQ